MITWFNNLNLKPQERRLVIGALVVGFILVNVWFVWPHFGDWAKNSRRAEDAEVAVTRYQKEVNNIPKYKALIKELEKDGSVSIAAAEQAIQFQKTIQEIANRSGVSINRYDPANPRRGTVTGNNNSNSQTNAFFEESGLLVQMQQVEEKDLVLFLYNLGSGNSNIRVKELELSPHNTGTKLVCKALLIASYQKAQTNKNSMLAPAAKPVGTAVNRNSASQNAAKTNTVSTTKTNLDNTNKTQNKTVETPAAATKTAGKKDTE